jgi:hypothetical protein
MRSRRKNPNYGDNVLYWTVICILALLIALGVSLILTGCQSEPSNGIHPAVRYHKSPNIKPVIRDTNEPPCNICG